MLTFATCLEHYGSADFESRLRMAIEVLPKEQLPLQKALQHSSVVSESPFQVMIIRVKEEGDTLRVKAGVFYAGIIAGCSCADDPTPIDEQAEHCELEFLINRKTGVADVCLLGD